jgi:type III secretory pathway lipoprotein EscJ
MAEENNLDNEFEDNMDDSNELDSLDGLYDDAGSGSDNQLAQPSQTPPSGLLNRIQGIPKAILSSRRNQVVFGVLFLCLLISIVVLFAREKSKATPLQNAGMVQAQSPTFDGSAIVQKKKTKKKKKKIKYVDLYKQLESKQLSPILRELSYLNISYNVVQNGKQFDLQVDEEQMDEAKHVLAIKGMPSGSVKGYEIFDEASNLGVTEFDKRIRLIRALSGEMEKSIMEFDVVDYAYVEIVIPETKLFAVTQPPVTSSILIKRKNGANINDETVYAIMQLVSNSVENLLPENISVVDTEGRVLSTGVLDRMTKKIKEIERKRTPPIAGVGNGKVIIPAIEDVVDWFQLKFNYETVLEKKAINQLNGVLPIGSYKTAVTIDLNSVSKTGAPDIKQVVTSLVVDDQFDEVELTNETMDQVRQAVAGAVGYVEGRDKIHISKASFLPKRVQQIAVEEDVKSEIVLPKDTVLDKLTRLGRLWPIFAIGCVITSGILVVLLFIKTVFEKLFQIISVIPTLFKRQKKDEPMDDEIVELNDPMVEEDIVLTEQDVINSLKTKSDFAKVIQLKALSTQELEVVVDELKELIKG